MKDVVIFEDGKGARGSRAKLVKRGNKRVLIEFTKYDYDLDKDLVVTEWFNVYTRWESKYNNKRKQAMYWHTETNEFYSDYWQTDEYKVEMKECFTAEYYEELFG